MTDTPTLKLYDSMTREKREFVPIDPNRVTMYNCGPTVYSYAHIGNARAAVVADVLFRVLRHVYGEDHVFYARNITDVDDKIIAAAKEQGVPISKITEKYTRIYQDNLRALNCLPPTYQPKATDAIDEMQDIIVELLELDFAYISGNNVLFDVTKMEDYGKLSGRKLEDNLSGARVEVASYKRNAADFLLWKYVEGENEEYSYAVPKIQAYADLNWRKYFNAPKQLSPGRPGWHIECSAMIRQKLGETIDIHCGGIDLKFPHHENEIAQSECANKKPLANYWVHNEFLNMGSTKMSKSLGNVTLIDDLLKDWDGEVIRLALLKAHYRSELSWSEDLLKESKAQLDGWYRDKEIIWKAAQKDGFNLSEMSKSFEITVKTKILTDDDGNVLNPDNVDEVYKLNTSTYMSDDLNTIRAFVFIGEKINSYKLFHSKVHNWVSAKEADNFYTTAQAQFNYINDLLGLLQKDPEEWFKGGASEDESAGFDAITNKRAAARKAKDWAAADAARDEATARGIVLEDQPDGTTTWRKT
ncbi:cysteine--tRNA ligase [Robiginitomaculum antarcticum]|uniref:cysteine--tRNA ligase n=1 Tax=Robiginitomaculum antarcticum TaxID=437507 RepID=UPI00037FA787|nr:cysteine--tRNA ligase [Robiginitomaculum antarcticum]